MTRIEMSDEIFAIAERLAGMDRIDVPTLVESLVRRHAEYIDMFMDMAEAGRKPLTHAERNNPPDATEQD
ncbi:hypothetical protein [Bradyrhizobium sp. RDI18]|uniref:hypothetical protein n=1 Tax=Bradyrhizobium sp. RDI18 TaxID=3367400 RepID=UPI0037143FAA